MLVRLPFCLYLRSPAPAQPVIQLHQSTSVGMVSKRDEHVSFHVAGDAYVDFFCFLDDGGWPENGGDSRLEKPVKTYAGGSATNTATHLKSLVHCFVDKEPQVALHTVLNPDDQYGQILLQHAKDNDFPIINCRDVEGNVSTGHCVAIVSGGERSFMTHQGCVGQFSADDLKIEKIISTPGDVHFHVAGFYNIPGFWDSRLKQKLVEIRRRREEQFPDQTTTISLVTQHDATQQWDGGFDEVLSHLDFAIMNDLEANHIVKRGRGDKAQLDKCEIQDWAAYFGALSAKTTIIVTRGEKGAVALRGGEIIVNQPTFPVDPVDPTGAGDSFTAGFIHGIWSQKLLLNSRNEEMWPMDAIEQGLRWGCAVGRAAVLVRGASVRLDPSIIRKFLLELKAL